MRTLRDAGPHSIADVDSGPLDNMKYVLLSFHVSHEICSLDAFSFSLFIQRATVISSPLILPSLWFEMKSATYRTPV